ncbi:hypothetical protein NDU88_001383 [Pleurodeles waltl]|uniref:Uncharacterized protein n=1 Tax=Pleurodeles waltl TaxID=8319 RepID=A0AAV7WM99_PLEWA|nr:hypothetical protein NDU88_001383 [Pleurodeles waltl]
MDTTSADHLQKWEANLQMASTNMIKQLIDISQEEYDKCRLEVDNLTQRIEEANWGEITTKNYAILNNIIDQYEEDIIQRKNRKFRRDLNDYQQGRVYTFGKQYDNIKDANLSLDTHSCSDTLPSSEVESVDETETRLQPRPLVYYSSEDDGTLDLFELFRNVSRPLALFIELRLPKEPCLGSAPSLRTPKRARAVASF